MPKSSKAKEIGKAREELAPVSRAIQLTQAITDLSVHASHGGRSKPLDRNSLLRLFETAGCLAQEAVTAQRDNFERCLKRYKDVKIRAREEVLKGVAPPSLHLKLLNSEIFSEDLFPKAAYLEADESALAHSGENFFPAAAKLASAKGKADNFKRPLPPPSAVQVPPRKKSKTLVTGNPPAGSNNLKENDKTVKYQKKSSNVPRTSGSAPYSNPFQGKGRAPVQHRIGR